MEDINSILHLAGKIRTMQNAGKMEKRLQDNNSTVTYPHIPIHFGWCFMEANPQEVVTEIILKDSQLKRRHAASQIMPLAIRCQKRLAQGMSKAIVIYKLNWTLHLGYLTKDSRKNIKQILKEKKLVKFLWTLQK